MKIRWWHAVALAAVVWLGRQLWAAAYTQGYVDGMENFYEMADQGDLQMEGSDHAGRP